MPDYTYRPVVQVFLSRRNLRALLTKLNKARRGEPTYCTIVKGDTEHPKYPQTLPEVYVTAVEDSEYYTDRQPGIMKEDLE